MAHSIAYIYVYTGVCVGSDKGCCLWQEAKSRSEWLKHCFCLLSILTTAFCGLALFYFVLNYDKKNPFQRVP